MTKKIAREMTLEEKVVGLPIPPRTLTPTMRWALFLGDIYTRYGIVIFAITGLLYYFALASGGLKWNDLRQLPLLAAAMTIPLDAAVVMTLIGTQRFRRRKVLLIEGLFAEGVREDTRPLMLWFPQTRWDWRRVYEITYSFAEADGRRSSLKYRTITLDEFAEKMLILYAPGTGHSVLFGEPGLPDIPSGYPEINEDGTFKPNTEPMAVMIVLAAIVLIIAGVFSLNLLFGH